MVGYTGGDNDEPTYESVCAGDGHSEAVQLAYDEGQISYEELLSYFFNLHAPNTFGKKQYKSAILFHNQEQKALAEKVSKRRGFPESVNLVQPASTWHDAEEYHQQYTKRQNFWFYSD